MRFPRPLSMATVLVLTACASSGSAGRSHDQSSDQVTRTEIAATAADNAHDLIQRLRPNWLRPPGTGSISGLRSQLVVVYLDGSRLGDLQSLRTLSANGIQSMQWLDATRAATVLNEVGSDPIRGAILIKTH